MEKKFSNLHSGEEACLYTIQNGGLTAKITNLGATLVQLWVPDASGTVQDVVLGYDDAQAYVDNDGFLGATVGRNANRIAGSRFPLDGKICVLTPNEGENNLHSGPHPYNVRLWTLASLEQDSVTLTLESPDGDQGFPGTAHIRVTYRLDGEGGLHICYEGRSDRETVFNMTNHSYFNLNGIGGGTILNHKLQIMADRLTESDAEALPNGKIYQAEGTPMDFRQLTPIGERIDDDFQQLIWGAGYDHNWILSGPVKDGLRQAAFAVSEESGITLSVYTDMPGMQFYSGNFLDGTPGKKDIPCKRRSGFALETQYFPNSPMHPEFPQPVLKRGNTWNSTTIFKAGLAE